MCKKHRDPRREKALDLRNTPQLRKACDRVGPPEGDILDHDSWQRAWNAQEDWMRKKVGLTRIPWYPDNAPAHFRRSINRQRRAQVRQSMREQLRDGVDDIVLPRFRRDANWRWF